MIKLYRWDEAVDASLWLNPLAATLNATRQEVESSLLHIALDAMKCPRDKSWYDFMFDPTNMKSTFHYQPLTFSDKVFIDHLSQVNNITSIEMKYYILKVLRAYDIHKDANELKNSIEEIPGSGGKALFFCGHIEGHLPGHPTTCVDMP